VKSTSESRPGPGVMEGGSEGLSDADCTANSEECGKEVPEDRAEVGTESSVRLRDRSGSSTAPVGSNKSPSPDKQEKQTRGYNLQLHPVFTL